MKAFFARHFTRLTGQDFHLHELIHGGFKALLLKAGSIVVVYLFYFSVAKLYGPEGNGLFSFCFTILNIFLIASLFGLDTYLIQQLPALQNRGSRQQIQALYNLGLNLVLVISLLLGILLFITASLLASYSHTLSIYNQGLQVTAVALIPASILKYNAEAFRGFKAITLYSLLQNISIFSFSLIFIFLFYFSLKNQVAIIYALLAGEVIVMIWSFALMKTRLNKPIRIKWPGIRGVATLSAAYPFLLTSATFFFMNWTDKLMLGFLASKAQLGIYDVALKVSNLGIIIIFAINSISAPKFSEFYNKGDLKGLARYTHQTTLLITLLTLPILITIYALPAPILSLFGEPYTAGMQSLLILIFGAFINAVAGSVIILLNMTEQQRLAQRLLLVTGILNLILNGILIPFFGIEGAAIATALTTIGWNLAGVWFIYQLYGFWTFQFTKLWTSQ